MKKARLLPVLLMLIGQTTSGQVYFEGLYGDTPSGQGIAPRGTVAVEDGYLTWSYSYGNFMPYLFRVDLVGNLVNELYMPQPDSIKRLTSNVVRLSDTIFLGMVSISVTTQTSDVQGDFGLVKFRINGDVIWENIYGMPDRKEIPQRVAITADGGFIMIGQVTIETQGGQEADVWLVKTDENGVVEWDQTFGGSNYDSGSDVVQTPDGGYLLLGWTRSYGAGQRDFYLIKTDSAGNDEWFETYGGGTDEGGASILGLEDGNYLLSGSGSNLTANGSEGKVYKILPNGDEVWSRAYVYQENSNNNFHKTIELTDGDLVSVGATGATGSAGWLVKTDSAGELIWQREYDKNESTDLFYSLLATEDGGFLLSGQAVNEETNSQDAWLLKVDSMGCTFPNCIVGLDEAGSKEIMVDVWPNPTSEVLHVQKMNDSKTLTFSVFDMNGNEVLNQVQYDAHGSIDVSKWAAGIYIMNGFSDKNTFFSIKFVKQ